MDEQQVSDQTRERIEKNGYCLWKCQALNGEVIAIAKNKGFRPRYFTGVVYDVRELVAMCKLESVLLIHEMKKEGYVLDGVEDD